MNEFEYMDEIKAPETWKTSAKALWTDAPAKRRTTLRLLRPLPMAAVIACLLIVSAAAAYVISNYRNPIVVSDDEAAQAAATEMEDISKDEDGYPVYSVSMPAEEQGSISLFLEGATYIYDHWLDETLSMDRMVLGIHTDPEWTFAGYDVSDGPLWKRHAVSADGWTETQYVAEDIEAMNGAEPDTVRFDVSVEDTGLALIPHSGELTVFRDENGKLLETDSKLSWFSEDERYLQMEYTYNANAIDWGTSFVIGDAYDETAEYTTADGREFVIETYQDRLWAESVTPNESYHFYAIGISMEEAEAILDQISVTIHG